jgi:hypothetical protein
MCNWKWILPDISYYPGPCQEWLRKSTRNLADRKRNLTTLSKFFRPLSVPYQQKQKVMQSLDRPLGFQEVQAPTISRHSAHEGGKVVSPMHWPPLPPRRYPWYSFRGWVDPRAIVRPKWLCQWHHRESNPRTIPIIGNKANSQPECWYKVNMKALGSWR